jgi:hypothetical protein
MPLTFSVPDTELSTTLHNRRAEIVDNIFQGTPYLMAMSRLGGTETADGGLELVRGLRLSKNTTAGSFTDYDLLDTTPQDNETSARFAPTGYYATISISWMEEKRNQGRAKLMDLLNVKTDDAGVSLRDQLNIGALASQPGSGSKDLNSMSELVDNDPSGALPRGTTSIGNIDGTAQTWWRNTGTSGGAFAVADMNTIFNTISDGHDFPTFMMTDQTTYEYYENSQVGQIRYQDTRVADAGFPTLQYKNTPIMWDPQIGVAGAIYFVNTKYTKLVTYANADFVTTDFVEPDNQAAKVAKILWMGQQVVTNRRRNGVLHSITAPA